MIINLQQGCIAEPERNRRWTNSIKVAVASKSFQFYPLCGLVDLKPTAFLKVKEKDFSASVAWRCECSRNLLKIVFLWEMGQSVSPHSVKRGKKTNDFHHQRGKVQESQGKATQLRTSLKWWISDIKLANERSRFQNAKLSVIGVSQHIVLQLKWRLKRGPADPRPVWFQGGRFPPRQENPTLLNRHRVDRHQTFEKPRVQQKKRRFYDVLFCFFFSFPICLWGR